jgi:hypothetical protein
MVFARRRGPFLLRMLFSRENAARLFFRLAARNTRFFICWSNLHAACGTPPGQ